MADSPTSRSLKMLREQGWSAGVVERYIAAIKRKQDLFGFADIVAMKPGEVPLLVQATTGANLAARRTKIAENEEAAKALHSGFRIVLHGWTRRKVKRGGKAVRWECREEEHV